MVNDKDNRVFYVSELSMGLIVTPGKFDDLKTVIFSLEASLLGQIFVLKNITFARGNYQPIVPRQKHPFV